MLQVGAGLVGLGSVIRDRTGVAVAARGRKIIWNVTPEDAETIALREGLLLAKETGFQQLQAECDALHVVQSLNC